MFAHRQPEHPGPATQTSTASLSSAHTSRGGGGGRGGESERQPDYLAATVVHKDLGGNKQADVSNEVGGFV